MPPPNSNQNVTVTMKFAANTKQAQRDVQDLQRDSDKLNKSQKELNKSGNESLMIWGKMVAMGHILTRVLDGASKAMATFGDSTLKTNEKWAFALKDFASGIPLFGALFDSIYKFGNEITGRAGDLRKAATMMQDNQVNAAVNSARDPWRMKHNDLIRADQISAWEAGGGTIDNFIIGRAGRGAGFNSEEMQGRGIRDAIIAQEEARQRATVAGNTARFDKSNITQFRDAYDTANQRASNSANKGGLFNQIEHLGNLQEVTRQRAATERQIVQSRESAVNLARQEYELAQATTNVQKQKYALLEQQVNKSKSAATEFGMMSGADKLALKYGLQQAQSQGFDTLPEETRQLLARSGVTGEFASKRAQRLAETDPIYGEIVRIQGGQTVTQLEEELKKLGTSIEVKIQTDKDDLKAKIREAAEEYFGEVQDIFMEAQRTEAARIRLGVQAGREMEKAAR